MTNYGLANVKVMLYEGGLPNIDSNYSPENFDISAFNWSAFQASNLFKPMLLEVIDDDNGGFSTIHPAKRKNCINNYMVGSNVLSDTSSLTYPYIVNSTVKKSDLGGSFGAMISNTSGTVIWTDYASEKSFINGATAPSDWEGPIWRDCPVENIVAVNDAASLKPFLTKYSITSTAESCEPGYMATGGGDKSIANINWSWQTKAKEGMWWAIKTNPFLNTNMPFWVTIDRENAPPTSEKFTSYIVVRFGGGTTDQVYDIWIGNNIRPYIIDYHLAPVPSSTAPSSSGGDTATTSTAGTTASGAGLIMEFENDLSRILDTEKRIEIGVMTVAGRLVFFINKNQYVYTRVKKTADSDSGAWLEAQIASGSVEVYGTNYPAKINISPMSFAPMGIMAVPIPYSNNSSNTTSSTTTSSWHAMKYDGTVITDKPSCVLPMSPSEGTDTLYGCDCSSYKESGGTTVNPTGTGFHQQGSIEFNEGGFGGSDSSKFWYMSLISANTVMNSAGSSTTSSNVCSGGCPYFFRLKGVKKPAMTGFSAAGTDISSYVISASINETAPDYFHVKKTATVSVYNPGGEAILLMSSMFSKQKGIKISLSWGSQAVSNVFTGVITNVNIVETPGKEIMTLTCSDYMYILNNIPIINSPFYDGMVARYAITDLAQRGGVAKVKANFTPTDNEYFLPSGYSFSQPAVRWPSTQKLFECIIETVRRFEAFVWFDAEGEFNISKLEGGLFSVVTSGTGAESGKNFYSTTASETTILGERNIDINFDSTSNRISIFTLDRDTKNAVIYGKSADDNALLYSRPALIDKSALGSMAAAKDYASQLGQRIFFPILKTRFSTVGTADLSPLSFIYLDGQSFRITSIKIDFNAENNEYKTSYECEWLGGSLTDAISGDGGFHA